VRFDSRPPEPHSEPGRKAPFLCGVPTEFDGETGTKTDHGCSQTPPQIRIFGINQPKEWANTHRLQKEGVKTARKTKNSRRPATMTKIKTHLANKLRWP